MTPFLPDERVMQQVWRFRLWREQNPVTSTGETIEIIDQGLLNTGPGPDFFNAKVKIGDQLWAGAVEVHVRASDWHRHGHDGDPAYRNVILHVVAVDDVGIERADGMEIPQVVMSVDDVFADTFNRLLTADRLVLPSCGDYLRDIASVLITDWVSALGMERLQDKAAHVADILDRSVGDWQQTAYVMLARGLGFGYNADAMESVARSVPVTTLLRHSDNLDAIQAILFGQAGMLDRPADTYSAALARDYAFYSHKYGLRRPDVVWNNTSRNGINTPERRLGLLASLIANDRFGIARLLSETTSVDAIREALTVNISPYWTTHTRFGRPSSSQLSSSVLGRGSMDLLIINVIAPLMYLRGERNGSWRMTDAAVALLEQLKAESNSIVRGFADFGVTARDAFTSQALIQLHRRYCEPRKCLDCRLGHRMLARHVVI